MKRAKLQGIARQLIEKLRLYGCAFDSFTIVKDRQVKIAYMLNNNSLLGSAISPPLKNNTYLRLDLNINTVSIVEIDNFNGDVLLKTIDLNDEELIPKIYTVYTLYFYTISEADVIFNKDIKNKLLISTLKHLHKHIPLRNHFNSSNMFRFYFGSSIFSIEVTYNSMFNDKLHSNIIFYKNNNRKYTNLDKHFNFFNGNNIKTKYVSDFRNFADSLILNTETINNYIYYFKKFKKMV